MSELFWSLDLQGIEEAYLWAWHDPRPFTLFLLDDHLYWWE